MNEDVLVADGITKTYKKNPVLAGLSFSLPGSALCALIGLNGAGKSTFLRILVGLARADTGSVRVSGQDSRFGAPPLAAYVAQDKPLHGSLRVRHVLDYAATLSGEFDTGYARDWLGAFGVPLDGICGRLSGGQRTQVALSAAMARRAPLVVLDEPMADLDPVARSEVSERLRAAAAEHETSVLISSHVLGDLENTCDRVVVLDRGRAALDGGVEQLQAEHRAVTGARGDVAAWIEQAGHVYVGAADGRDGRTVVRVADPETLDAPPPPEGLRIEPATLEDITLAVLRGGAQGRPSPSSS